jgi:hypothetical protein
MTTGITTVCAHHKAAISSKGIATVAVRTAQVEGLGINGSA